MLVTPCIDSLRGVDTEKFSKNSAQ
jgi:hypothetical protein